MSATAFALPPRDARADRPTPGIALTTNLVGQDALLNIVCGAPNARAGITVVLCKPGDYVPGIDVTLGVGKIRGVESHGMMASERELELSDEHNGIIELASGEVDLVIGNWLSPPAELHLGRLVSDELV